MTIQKLLEHILKTASVIFLSDGNCFYINKFSRGNHKLVFTRAGFNDIREYRYWDAVNRCIDMKNLVADLEAAPPKLVNHF